MIEEYPYTPPVADRSGWPHGPWDNEPDSKTWIDAATGYRCAITRVRGHLNGYVRVPDDHPAVGEDYDTIEGALQVDVHGALTFGKGPWFGFDCAHAWDNYPGMLYPEGDEVYRDVAYVEAECAKLASGLMALKEGGE